MVEVRRQELLPSIAVDVDVRGEEGSLGQKGFILR
jgi:hypothetical protein